MGHGGTFTGKTFFMGIEFLLIKFDGGVDAENYEVINDDLLLKGHN